MMKVRRITCMALAVTIASHASGQAELAPAFQADYSITSLGLPAGVPGNLGGLAIHPNTPDVLHVAGDAETAAGAIYSVPLARDRAGHITGLAGPGILLSTAPGAHGGGIGGSLISYYDSIYGALLTYISSDGSFGGVFADDETPTWLQDLQGQYGEATPIAHALVPCGFPEPSLLKVVTDDPAAWYEVVWFITRAGEIIIFPDPVPITPLDGGPRSIVYVDGSSPAFGGADVVLISKRDAGRIDAYRLDGLANPIAATVFPFVNDIAGAEGLTIDPITGDLIISTSPVDDVGHNEILLVTGFGSCPAGDLNGDGAIDSVDLLALLGQWGQCDQSAQTQCAGGSLDCDGDVDVADLITLLANWGACTGS